MTSLLDATNGHGRRILPWILEQADTDDTAAFRVTSMSTLHGQLWDAIHDPAKLAELTAFEAKRCGHEVGVVRIVPLWEVWGYCGRVYIDSTDTRASFDLSTISDALLWFAMPKARTILAALLPLPDGAREQTERILRGET